MALTDRENFVRNASMTGPEWMPMIVAISSATWNQLGPDLEKVVMRHPTLFPGFQPGQRKYLPTDANGMVPIQEIHTDNWGCVWERKLEGICGEVIECPLDDWDKFADYTLPDPITQGDDWAFDWTAIRQRSEEQNKQGALRVGALAHGFLFMRLYYLRGFANLMMDYALEEPRLQTLIDRITAYNSTLVRQYLNIGVDVIDGGDDLGTQTASMISPAMFRKWITPAYKKIFGPAREAGCHVALHSDGHMIELIDEIIDAGVTICNPQDLCNGIDEIKAAVDGRICIRLDVDRQSIVPFGTPKEIHDLIEEEVRKLGSPRGGLELIIGIYPPTPLENIEAVCSAFEEYRTYWFDGRAKN
ncbi:MAG: uroporphyrinogen decarboxylase family protein [Armatimonadota bacterium]